MPDTPWTPGPWRRGDGSPVEYGKGYAIVGADGPILAKVLGTGYPIGRGSSPESEANARLIAAAPELVEALERLANADYEPLCTDSCQKARALLARVRGEVWMYVLQRTERAQGALGQGGGYVALSGSEHSYTTRIEEARLFTTQESAERVACKNERAIPLAYILKGWPR